MAKKQTRRSISVSRSTYERLKAFCEANHVSMSQLVETRVNDFLGADGAVDVVRTAAPRPPVPSVGPGIGPGVGPGMGPGTGMSPGSSSSPGAGPGAASIHGAPVRPSAPAPARPVAAAPAPSPAPAPPIPMTSAAARIAIEPPPPIIKPRQETAAPKPAEKRPDQIFTF